MTTAVVSMLLILLYQNCGNDPQAIKGITTSPSTAETTDSSGDGTMPGGSTTAGTTSGGSASGGSTSGGTTSGGATTGGSATAGSTTGSPTPSNVFPSSLNFNFRRATPIVMPINSLMPLPYDITGEFTVLSIVSSDLFRIRKYLGNSIDIGTRIPVRAGRGETSITLALNHVATEYLRARAIITLMSQANPNVLPQQITITIEPQNSDIVDAFHGIRMGNNFVSKTYDGRLFSPITGTTNLATLGKIHFNEGIYPSFAQELADGRTFMTTIDRDVSINSQLLSRGVYINDKISFFSALNSSEIAAISEDKNYFYIGGATGDADYLPLNTRYPSPVGPLKSIYHALTATRRTLMVTESGNVYSVPRSYSATSPVRLLFSTPVELNFGAPVIKSFIVRSNNSLTALVTSNNRIYLQDPSSTTASNIVIDQSTEPGMIDEVVGGFYGNAQSYVYVRFSTGRHYTLVVSNTGAVISKSPSVHNPDFHFLSDAWNGTYYMLDHRTGAGISPPIR